MSVDVNLCRVVDALSDLQVSIMEALNGRFASLRRLANLLEQAGDLTGFIPDISKLIPVSKIDVSLYDDLRLNCPYLNLPAVDSGTADQYIGKLRQQLNTAYGQLLSKLNLHPFSMMGKLQDKLNEYQNSVNRSLLYSSDFLRCLQTICTVGEQALTAVAKMSSRSATSILKTSQDYTKNFVDEQGKVLSGEAQAKWNDLKNVKTGVQDLMDVKS